MALAEARWLGLARGNTHPVLEASALPGLIHPLPAQRHMHGHPPCVICLHPLPTQARAGAGGLGREQRDPGGGVHPHHTRRGRQDDLLCLIGVHSERGGRTLCSAAGLVTAAACWRQPLAAAAAGRRPWWASIVRYSLIASEYLISVSITI